MPVLDFSDFADVTENGRKIEPRHNRKVGISVDKSFLYINDNAFVTGCAGFSGAVLMSSGTEMYWGEGGGWGATGLPGPTGAYGGPQGDTGLRGIQGETGLIGVQGATGVQGMTGAQGNTGIQGETGLIGAQGYTGLRGITGLAGAQGATGIRGVTGAQGNDGIKSWNYLFCAALESDVPNVTGDDTLYTIICDNIYTGNNENYNPSTGIFTAPVDGCYQFIGAITYRGFNGIGVVGEIVTSGHIFMNCHYNVSGAGYQLTIPISCMAWLNAGQTAYMAIKTWGDLYKTTDVIGYVNGGYPQTHYTYFSGYCVFEKP